jgi:hypothetical protein
MNTIVEDSDTHRICGTCGESKPFDKFYKDGADRHNKPKYRRDCKDCYKRTRITEQKAKKKGGRY